MKKTTKTAKTVTFPVPVFTVTARKPRNYAVSGVSGVKISGVPVDEAEVYKRLGVNEE